MTLAYQIALGYAAVLWYAIAGVVAYRIVRKPGANEGCYCGYCEGCVNEHNSRVAGILWPIVLLGHLTFSCAHYIVIAPARKTATLLIGRRP